MPNAEIIYFGRKAKVACDSKCNKAWGINGRPRISLSKTDEDDYAWKSDKELGKAPRDPGTYEGSDGKPGSAKEFPNKWCVRACERCSMSGPDQWNKPLELKDLSKRFYNKVLISGKTSK